ncbi:MarR family transcriptional regulator [Nocardioides albertanoniae]|uniref:MarR family transcriptional regulator n=1 Tax=Nocardioides albertanoniae TaxID=1175486 RepID=A0A543A329_9ACTN|nr:MarR family transcriptional regulator [Nocardioides albertanoniae]TQL66988.1 MarR family transcriptional regulator [Nocardioides albertanoniae]
MDPIREAQRQWIAHGWDAAADGMALVTSLARVHQLVMERIDASLRPHDLSFARYEVLRLLAFTHGGELPMAKLGSRLQVHPASVTSAVGRLEKQSLVRRARSETDRRVVLAAITDEGREAVEAATVSLNTEVFEKPGIEEVRELTALLSQLREASGDSVGTSMRTGE